ncbi:MAG: DUF599 family protein [Gammaproteobacteria bacterium]|nr:DUF599 family protein [Gammaproteobacteria bacterium]
MIEGIMKTDLPMMDLAALAWFVVCWASYLVYTGRTTRISLLNKMDQWREEWALSLTRRNNRIVDSQVINGLVRKETFFASTTILIIASSIALMGVGDKANQLASDIPFIQHTTPALWFLKVIVLALIFVYAFFKFSWSIRQHSYSAILLGSIPEPESSTSTTARDHALRLARLNSLGARHFNDGIRAYYFALAELSWFINPLLLFAAVVWVVVVLYRREFHSRALLLLSRSQD